MLVPPKGFLSHDNIITPFESATQEGPDGQMVTRARSYPLSFPFPEGDPNEPETWQDTEVRLCDVGVACWGDKISEHFTDLIQSPALRAPEVCIGSGWGKPADIWSLGCTVFELCAGRTLFPASSHPQTIPFEHAITFGQYPIEMVKQGKYSQFFYKPDGSLKIDVPLGEYSLERIIHGQDNNDPIPGNIVLFDFLKRMLTVDPVKRATCQELLSHEWLNSL